MMLSQVMMMIMVMVMICDNDDVIVVKLVHDVVKAGINYIDTAPWYGQGRSETVLGKAFK